MVHLKILSFTVSGCLLSFCPPPLFAVNGAGSIILGLFVCANHTYIQTVVNVSQVLRKYIVHSGIRIDVSSFGVIRSKFKVTVDFSSLNVALFGLVLNEWGIPPSSLWQFKYHLVFSINDCLVLYGILGILKTLPSSWIKKVIQLSAPGDPEFVAVGSSEWLVTSWWVERKHSTRQFPFLEHAVRGFKVALSLANRLVVGCICMHY